MTTRRLSVVGVMLLAVVCCEQRRPSDATPPPPAVAEPSSTAPLDRLAPGELAQSAQQVFGFPIPREMRLERAYPDAVHLVGEVEVAGIAEYVRKHADVGAPELIAQVLRFDRGRIRNQKDQRLYRFDISQRGRQVQLLISDVTPPPIQPGLTDEERWRLAGLKPDGTPLDISNLR